ncbi:chemotaxis protein CheV [Thiohalobacter sp. IOR34]|uniref:chemotaxis protein CheV n=1 Tax=Thiohalobacter sp. IOR34 TaxID=3057176 RepID=UPI0025B06285|nr:chemotaxis protein CheV [Thiohalobacter sp. IOR34]WJW74616.1 chemotaxis protein CheV [Thiohalobacter sp. IOR34]
MSSVLASVDQRTQLAGHNRLEILTFRLDNEQRFGINVFKIQEVIQCPALTSVPHAHHVIRGIATLRGRTIPVLDLAMAIGRTPIDDPRQAFVIVTEFNRSVQGFLVSSVERIVNMNWEQILPPPKGTGMNSYLTAITEIDEELVEIIDVEKVLSEVIGAEENVSQEILEEAEANDKDERLHVLVADDSMVARNQIKRTLDELGVSCTLAGDGKKALDKLLEWADNEPEKIDNLAMVISDVEMPEMDGYTFTTRVRAEPRLSHLYILLHTSLSGVFNNAMVEKVGANEFIAKFKPDLLASSVLKQIENKSKGHAA